MPGADRDARIENVDDVFPRLSPGILCATTLDGGVLYDLVSEHLSFLNPSGAALADACGRQLDRHERCGAWASGAGVSVARVAGDVDAALETFRAAGFVGRSEPPPTIYLPDAPVTPLADDEHSTIQAAGLHRIRFRSRSTALIAAIDDTLGLTSTDPPTADFQVVLGDDGTIGLLTDTEWRFAGRGDLLDRLVTVVNDFVARTTTGLVLHAAAMQSPGGATIVFPAAPGSGKSTLAAHLLQHGWAYLGDESVTIRTGDLAVVPCAKPISLDERSCEALDLPPEVAGDVPVDVVAANARVVRCAVPPPTSLVSPNYVGPDGDPEVATLGFTDALVAGVGNALNLRYVGNPGLATLVALATHVPVHTIAYRSGDEGIAQLAGLGIDS